MTFIVSRGKPRRRTSCPIEFKECCAQAGLCPPLGTRHWHFCLSGGIPILLNPIYSKTEAREEIPGIAAIVSIADLEVKLTKQIDASDAPDVRPVVR